MRLFMLHVRYHGATGRELSNGHAILGPDTLTPSGVIGIWQESCQDSFLAMLPGTYRLDALACTEIVAVGAPPPATLVTFVGLDGTGGSHGQELADWLVCRATIYSGLAGRQYRGANLFAGGGEDDVDGEQLLTGTSSWWFDVGTYLTELAIAFADIEGSGQWAVFSRTRWSAGGGTPDDWAVPALSYVVHTSLRSLRRRRVATS